MLSNHILHNVQYHWFVLHLRQINIMFVIKTIWYNECLTFTGPKLPNETYVIREDTIKTDSFNISFPVLEKTYVTVLINPPNIHGIRNFTTEKPSEDTLQISYLKSGTYYSAEVRYMSSENYGISDPYNLSTYTSKPDIISCLFY
jgi:hypothetical protein